MAKNVGGRRIGAIRGRTQFQLPNGHYAKRNRYTGEIMSVKADHKPYKNVVIERDPATRSQPGAPTAHPRPHHRVGMPLLNRPSWRARQRPLATLTPLELPGDGVAVPVAPSARAA